MIDTLAKYSHEGPFHLAKNVYLPITPMHIDGAWKLNPPGSNLIYPGKVDLEFLPSISVEVYILLIVGFFSHD